MPLATDGILDIDDILDAVQSHAAGLGYFQRVGTHEPKSPPGNGLTCAIWVQDIEPLQQQSGLASTTILLTLNLRLYTSMLTKPEDLIDPALMKAVSALMAAYSRNFTLSGLVRNVDLLGITGKRLGARAGYLNQDGKTFRVFTVTLPLIVDDLWEQAE